MQLVGVDVFNHPVYEQVENPLGDGNYRRDLSCRAQLWAIELDFVTICLVVASSPGFFCSVRCHQCCNFVPSKRAAAFKNGLCTTPTHWLCPAGPVMIRVKAFQKVFHLLSILPKHTES